MLPKGSHKLVVLLCKFTDNSNIEPHPIDFYKELITDRGTGGLNDYWISASQNAINIDGTDVFGWRTLNISEADYFKTVTSRWGGIKMAIDAFPEIDTSKYYGVIAMYNTDVKDSGAAGKGVLASPTAMSVTFLAHETGHLFGLQHSFDQSDRKDAKWSAPGEYYDSYDIMSAMNVYSTPSQKFGQTGPLLCAANLDHIGLLDTSRVWVWPFGNSSGYDEVDIVSMSHPEISGYIAAQIGAAYVEFRTVEDLDAGIPQPCVLIHTMSGGNAVVMASDKANYINNWQPGQVYGPSSSTIQVIGGTQIKIISFNLNAKTARIGIRVVAQPMVIDPRPHLIQLGPLTSIIQGIISVIRSISRWVVSVVKSIFVRRRS